MNRHARLNALLDFIAAHGHVDVDKTARSLGVSTATIRRDLNHLHDQQLVSRTHGGAVATSVSYDLPIRYRSSKRRSEKIRIAQAAAALVGPGAVVGLNGGTTTTEVARAIADQAAHTAGDGSRVTILTNAINIAGELTVRQHVKLVMTGGVALPQSFELTGSLAGATLRQVELDLAIIGVDAFDADLGARAVDEQEASVNKLMARQASRVVIVADSSKLTARAFALICPPTAVHDLVTDRYAPTDIVRRLSEAGINVILV